MIHPGLCVPFRQHNEVQSGRTWLKRVRQEFCEQALPCVGLLRNPDLERVNARFSKGLVPQPVWYVDQLIVDVVLC